MGMYSTDDDYPEKGYRAPVTRGNPWVVVASFFIQDAGKVTERFDVVTATGIHMDEPWADFYVAHYKSLHGEDVVRKKQYLSLSTGHATLHDAMAYAMKESGWDHMLDEGYKS